MAQGTIKKPTHKPISSNTSKRPSSNSSRKSKSTPLTPQKGISKGRRTIPPKRTSLIKQQKITKKVTAGLIGKTERNLAEKAGHLEMLEGGKKGKGKGGREKGKEG